MEEEQEAAVDLLDLLGQLLVVDVVPRQRTVVATVARLRTVTSIGCIVGNIQHCSPAHWGQAVVVDTGSDPLQ